MQKILVVQKNGMGALKVAAIRELGLAMEVRVIDAIGPFPPLIDEPENNFPPELEEGLAWADIVLDHVYHADLTGYLMERAKIAGKPVVASGRKVPGIICPTTCCTLPRLAKLGEYAEAFGLPEVKVEVSSEGVVEKVEVVRGAPCGATWRAAEKLVGMKAEDAAARFGLETQFNCYAKANPNVFLTNPLHVAGDVHAEALEKALGKTSAED